jgi:hypothetical protein
LLGGFVSTKNNFIAAALSISNARHSAQLAAENIKKPIITDSTIFYNATTSSLLIIAGKKEFLDPDVLRQQALENMADIYNLIATKTLNQTDKLFLDANFDWITRDGYTDFQLLLNRTSMIKTFLGVD